MAVGDLVLLSLNKRSSRDDEEKVAGEGSGFSRELVAVSTGCGCGENCAIVKRASVCISQTGSVTVRGQYQWSQR